MSESCLSSVSLSAAQEAFEAVLNASITTAAYVDTQFSLYSRRARSGKVFAPRETYGNSTVLKTTSPGFHALLTIEATVKSLASSTDAYEYDEDSDLEDQDEPTAEAPIAAVQSSQKANISYSSDSDDDESPMFVVHTTPARSALPNIPSTSSYRTVLIPNVAFNTWCCLLAYVYTGKLVFAPLRSQGKGARAAAVDNHSLEHPSSPSLCSPKSMFRLADKLGYDGIKKLCLANIRSQLSKNIILDELFSTLTAQFHEVREMELSYFRSHCLVPSILSSFQAKLEDVTTGHAPHAATVLTALFAAWISSAQTDAHPKSAVVGSSNAAINQVQTPAPSELKEMLTQPVSPVTGRRVATAVAITPTAPTMSGHKPAKPTSSSAPKRESRHKPLTSMPCLWNLALKSDQERKDSRTNTGTDISPTVRVSTSKSGFPDLSSKLED